MSTDTHRNEMADSRGPDGEWLYPELRVVPVAGAEPAGGESPSPATEAPAGSPTLLTIAE